MTTISDDLKLGTGIYSVSDAAHIVGRSIGRASASQIRYWIREGLSDGTTAAEGTPLLSFQDLVSLEMISRFRHRGISLQAIRVADRKLRIRHPDLQRPLANLVFYTDGQNLWALVGSVDDSQLLEILGRTDQYAWHDAIETFAKEITFTDGSATIWRPNEWVEINPKVQFGEPVVVGTRVPVRTVMANLEVGSPAEVADWYGLSREQVIGARKYIDHSNQ